MGLTHLRQLRLDEGGFARLDVSDLGLPQECHHDRDTGDTGDNEASSSSVHGSRPCDWCGSAQPGGGEYLVVADNRHYAVCPTCWGRSPGYVELRQEGAAHREALIRLGAGVQAA
jgi:hypothetical protein